MTVHATVEAASMNYVLLRKEPVTEAELISTLRVIRTNLEFRAKLISANLTGTAHVIRSDESEAYKAGYVSQGCEQLRYDVKALERDVATINELLARHSFA